MGLSDRLRRLERIGGSSFACTRCSGVRGLFVTGLVQRADSEWQERVCAEGGSSACPECGRSPARINVVEEEAWQA